MLERALSTPPLPIGQGDNIAIRKGMATLAFRTTAPFEEFARAHISGQSGVRANFASPHSGRRYNKIVVSQGVAPPAVRPLPRLIVSSFGGHVPHVFSVRAGEDMPRVAASGVVTNVTGKNVGRENCRVERFPDQAMRRSRVIVNLDAPITSFRSGALPRPALVPAPDVNIGEDAGKIRLQVGNGIPSACAYTAPTHFYAADPVARKRVTAARFSPLPVHCCFSDGVARWAAASANCSRDATPSRANAAQCSDGILSRCIHERTVWIETPRDRATASAAPAAFTMSE